MQTYDAIIIGAGHNGLTTAAYLAKAGQRVLVLERRSTIGGIAATEEAFTGFKYSTCAHLAGTFSPTILGDLELSKHGLELIPLDPALIALNLDGEPLSIAGSSAGNSASVRGCSTADSAKLEPFSRLVSTLSSFLARLYAVPLPDGGAQSLQVAELVKIGWRFHRLGKREMAEFLRILPMSIADWLREWFDGELLTAALARAGMLGTFAGPRAQGTSLVFLHRQLGQTSAPLQSAAWVRGGIANLAHALARSASGHGTEIRTSAEVAEVIVKNGRAMGVVLSNGDEFSAATVISNADAKNTFLKLVRSTYLDPHFLWQVNNIRTRGTLAKVNFALDALPAFRGLRRADAAVPCGGVIHIGPTLDYLERAADDAKYGRVSARPLLEITIPTVIDSSLAPAGRHVMSVWMQSAPYHLRDGSWPTQREAVGDIVAKLIEDHAPGFTQSILHRQVLTPLDLEEIFGLTGGHIHHGEMALDQMFFMRPVSGWARYRTPIEGLYLCGSGTHPGGEISGLPGYYAAREILRRSQRAGNASRVGPGSR